MWLAVWLGGVLVDTVRERRILSTAAARKTVFGFGNNNNIDGAQFRYLT